MDRGNRISLSDLCRHYALTVDFVQSLDEMGLIPLIEEENQHFVDEVYLRDLEVILHLHYDLDINLEGIDAITHLLLRMEEMQRELNLLRTRQI